MPCAFLPCVPCFWGCPAHAPLLALPYCLSLTVSFCFMVNLIHPLGGVSRQEGLFPFK